MMTRMIISIMIICIIECKKGSSENEGERKKEAGNRAARVKREDTEEETGDQRQRNLYLIIKNKTEPGAQKSESGERFPLIVVVTEEHFLILEEDEEAKKW